MEGGERAVDKELRRRRWIINRKLEGRRSTEIATALRSDERTVYPWWSVYRKQRWEGLHVKSHRPHMIHRTSQATVDLILQLRRARNWGPCRIEGYLRNYNRQSRVGHTTIHKILNQAGLSNPIPRPRRIWANADSNVSTATVDRTARISFFKSYIFLTVELTAELPLHAQGRR